MALVTAFALGTGWATVACILPFHRSFIRDHLFLHGLYFGIHLFDFVDYTAITLDCSIACLILDPKLLHSASD